MKEKPATLEKLLKSFCLYHRNLPFQSLDHPNWGCGVSNPRCRLQFIRFHISLSESCHYLLRAASAACDPSSYWASSTRSCPLSPPYSTVCSGRATWKRSVYINPTRSYPEAWNPGWHTRPSDGWVSCPSLNIWLAFLVIERLLMVFITDL